MSIVTTPTNQSPCGRPPTARQGEIYAYILEHVRDRGYGPTVREIGSQFGIRSPNGVLCHLKALRAKGLLAWDAKAFRTLRLTTPADTVTLPRSVVLAAVGEMVESETRRRLVEAVGP